MKVTSYKTKKVQIGDNLFSLLDEFLPTLKERDIVIITSKIVSICQDRVIKNDGTVDKRALIHQESDLYMEEENLARYGIILTIKNNVLIASAGIDESNGNGYFILWPQDIHRAAAEIWQHLREKHSIKNIGVIITDSHTTPLRWGTTGIGLAWCGFEPLKNYIETPDIFGRNLHVTKASILDGLAAAAVTVMGEGNEQTPLALIRDIPFVQFQNRPPTDEEITSLRISLIDDIYSPLINSSKWKRP